MGILRQLPTDNHVVKKRLAVLEQWIAAGTIEPWHAVILAEWARTPEGLKGDPPTAEQYEDLFDGETLEAMRAQVDGPWMIHAAQARSERGHRHVMGFLDDLEAAMNEKAV